MNTRARVNYHRKSEHSQAFVFDVDGQAGHIISPTLIEREVNVDDLRHSSQTMHFEEHGIKFMASASSIKDFGDHQAWQAIYDQEIKELLVQHIDAAEVLVFDHTLRVDDVSAERKPARNVHNDYSAKSAEQRLNDLLGPAQAEAFKEGAYGFVNVWRPIQSTIHSSPLGFVRPDSIDLEDWMKIDLIYPDRKGEILGLAPNDKHQWFYWSQMRPDEVAIFNIYDNRSTPFLAHSALDLIKEDDSTMTRKSIETRTLVRYR